jgi:hypothetical protein
MNTQRVAVLSARGWPGFTRHKWQRATRTPDGRSFHRLAGGLALAWGGTSLRAPDEMHRRYIPDSGPAVTSMRSGRATTTTSRHSSPSLEAKTHNETQCFE